MKKKTKPMSFSGGPIPEFDPVVDEDNTDKYFIPTPHEFIVLFISALVSFVHPDCPYSINHFPHLTSLQMTYWRLNFHKITELIAETLKSACQSEWWQMVFAAQIKLGHDLLMHFNEDKFPLEKPGNEQPVQILTIEAPEYISHSTISEALAKQGKKLADVRETLLYLQSNWQSLKSETGLLSKPDSKGNAACTWFIRGYKQVRDKKEKWRYKYTDRLNKHLTASSSERLTNDYYRRSQYRLFVVDL